jgi:ABC-type transport system involved in multi-copper enzyme maturation permease subunit
MMTTVTPTLPVQARVPAPKFLGVLSGELFKLSRQRTTWITMGVVVVMLLLPWLGSMALRNASAQIAQAPLLSLIRNYSGNLSWLRVWSGFGLTIITAQCIGLDYQQGTIRIVLGRGVERLQLLGAKLLTIALVGAAILGAGLLINTIFGALYYQIEMGNLNAFHATTPTFWADIRIDILTVVISMVATILLTTAATVLGRSVAFGMTVGLSFFAADNIGTVIMLLINRITGSDFWLNITGYFLGPNLNTLSTTWIQPIPILVSTDRGTGTIQGAFYTFGSPPLVNYDLTHVLTVIAVYSLVFAATAIGLTWRRDVLE